MPRTVAGRALALCYLGSLSVVAGGLVLVGYLIDRLPGVPARVGRTYARVLLGSMAALAAPADGWSEPTPEEPAPGAAAERADGSSR